MHTHTHTPQLHIHTHTTHLHIQSNTHTQCTLSLHSHTHADASPLHSSGKRLLLERGPLGWWGGQLRALVLGTWRAEWVRSQALRETGLNPSSAAVPLWPSCPPVQALGLATGTWNSGRWHLCAGCVSAQNKAPRVFCLKTFPQIKVTSKLVLKSGFSCRLL